MTTRAQLVTDVDEWLARDDVAAGSNFDSILRIADAEIGRVVRTLIQELYVQLTFTGQTEPLPTNFLEFRSEPTLADAADPQAGKLVYMPPDVIRGDPAFQVANRGSFYSVIGDRSADNFLMLLAPPGSVTTPTLVDVQYIARFASLVNPSDTNWLLTNHYDVYLYATLRAAAEYLQEDALEDRYLIKFERANAQLAKMDNRRRIRMGTMVARGSPRAIV